MGLVFFESGSRGSSWQRCAMFRLIHLVHGRSCHDRLILANSFSMCTARHGARVRSRQKVKRKILHTRSHVICWKPRDMYY